MRPLNDAPDILAPDRLNGALDAREPHDAPTAESIDHLCHDVRQAAATIDAIVAAVTLESEFSSTVDARLKQIVAEARFISDLCKRAVAPVASTELVELDVLVASVVQSARAASANAIELDAQPVVVRADPSALRRMATNLLDNAIRAAGAGGRVDVEVRTHDRDAVLVVADSGPGFPKGTPGSDGHGLAIAARAVLAYGGRVALERSVVLGGTQIEMVLPAVGRGQLSGTTIGPGVAW